MVLPKDRYRQIYYEGLDFIAANCIRYRFDQPGYKVYSNLQELLLKASTKTDFEEEYVFATKFHGSDCDPLA